MGKFQAATTKGVREGGRNKNGKSGTICKTPVIDMEENKIFAKTRFYNSFLLPLGHCSHSPGQRKKMGNQIKKKSKKSVNYF